MFNFKIVQRIDTDDDENCYLKYHFVIFEEESTGSLFIEHDGKFVQMLDPETGKPLTYEVWKEKYNK